MKSELNKIGQMIVQLISYLERLIQSGLGKLQGRKE
jgi:hypothetical protein